MGPSRNISNKTVILKDYFVKLLSLENIDGIQEIAFLQISAQASPGENLSLGSQNPSPLGLFAELDGASPVPHGLSPSGPLTLDDHGHLTEHFNIN